MKKTSLSIILLAAFLPSCIGTFEEAKPTVRSTYGGTLGAAPVDRARVERCDKIDNLQLVFGGTTLILGAAAGASGLTAWRVKDDGTKDALVIGAGAAGLLAVGTGYIWDSKQKQWVREGCATLPTP